MRLHRFYTAESIDPKHEVKIHSTELMHQIRRVFRLDAGDSVVLFNGTGFDHECKIDSFDEGSKILGNNCIRLHVTMTKRSRISSKRRLYLCAAIVKKDTFEWIAEKATELGVTDIIPVLAERSEKKSLNEMRLLKIAVEASEQSGRGDIPMVHPVMGLADVGEFLEKNKGIITKIAFHTEGKRLSRKEIHQDSNLAIFIGPEGGWSESEVEMFHKDGIILRSLGDQVLRAETAVIAALSQVVFDVV